MFYTETKADTVILGALVLNKFTANPTENDDCFQVMGEANETWLLCSSKGGCPESWKTALSRIFGTTWAGCPPMDGDFKTSKNKIKREYLF